jgi:hypothetical protein
MPFDRAAERRSAREGPRQATLKMAELVLVVDVAVFAIVIAGVASQLGRGVRRRDSPFPQRSRSRVCEGRRDIRASDVGPPNG